MAASVKVDIVDDKKLKKEKKSKDKAEKKDKKRSEDGIRKEKKDKKKDKVKQDKLARALDAHLADAAADVETKEEAVEVDPEDIIKPAEELVPFALPLADEKAHKKIYKLIKKGALAFRASQVKSRERY